MDMKLNSQCIKALRLKRSWSQEKLAEIAGLNQRTIQRVESEGSGSLQTRLSISRALGVEPADLDVLEGVESDYHQPAVSIESRFDLVDGIRRYASDKNIYHFTLLLIISCLYLVSKAVYFSFSFTSFSWVNFSLGRPLQEVSLWWVMTISFWLILIVPWLFYIYKRNRAHFRLYLAALCIPLSLAIIRLWQPDFIMSFLSSSLYYCGLALLISLYFPQFDNGKIKKTVHIFLFSYIFIWFFQGVGHHIVVTTFVVLNSGEEYPWSYIGTITLEYIPKLVQLIPIALVLIFSLKGDKKSNGKTPAILHNSSLQPNKKAEPSATRLDKEVNFSSTPILLNYSF